jgi:hypothetical protein
MRMPKWWRSVKWSGRKEYREQQQRQQQPLLASRSSNCRGV